MNDSFLSSNIILETPVADRQDADEMNAVANELLASEWEEFQIHLAELRAQLVHTKRELAQATELNVQKDADIEALHKQISELHEQASLNASEQNRQRLYGEKLYHRVNELVTHVEQRDYQIAQLANRRAIKIANGLVKLKRKLLGG